MASAPLDNPPKLRCESPSPNTSPTPALHARPELSRCLSTASSVSHGSATTDASNMRESLGSDISAFSRHSSASYQSSRRSDASFGPPLMPLSRQSTGSLDNRSVSGTAKRRGYMRPHGTDFAASARARESVLSLGSIAHLQYYFARTGLLDSKRAKLARQRLQKAHTLDLSALDTSSFLNPSFSGSDVDSSYASMGSSPDLAATGGFGSTGVSAVGADSIVESPIEEDQQDDGYYFDDYEDPDPDMLPPTVSTYNYREKPLPKPPSMAELKTDLTNALESAFQSLAKAKTESKPPEGTDSASTPTSSPSQHHARQQSSARRGTGPSPPGWHEIQGMHILDVMTLAIRAAKVYYTAHEQPDRLDAIKSEKQLRSELLTVMDVLKRMATRGFVGGMRDDEFASMDDWIASVRAMLASEEDMEAAEAAERASWTWLRDDGWEGREYEREHAFMESMLAGGGPIVSIGSSIPSPGLRNPIDITQEPHVAAANSSTTAAASQAAAAAEAATPLPAWTPIDRSQTLTDGAEAPTPFLAALRSGVRLVHLHNCAVRRSRRRFGAIQTFHTDTQKQYRAADNIRYWVKAAELRWELPLRLDALAVVYGSPPEAWLDFEDAVLTWCRKVREEITAEVQTV